MHMHFLVAETGRQRIAEIESQRCERGANAKADTRAHGEVVEGDVFEARFGFAGIDEFIYSKRLKYCEYELSVF
jgi:hypothetical protein